MEFFRRAKTVRLQSHHDKYLMAEKDQESVCQDRHGSSRRIVWTVEFVEGIDNVVRLKSYFGKYLTAVDEQHLLGVTGRKVLQTLPRKLDSSLEWEPIREGHLVKLKTRYGNYLRANGGVPPWRNSITHDVPHRHRDWILWHVDILESLPKPPPPPPKELTRADSLDSEPGSPSIRLRSPRSTESSELFVGSPVKSEGRMIHYGVLSEEGGCDDETEGPSFNFKGHGLEELTEKLEEVTGLENIIVCSRNPLNGKLYPLRLQLPPNNASMNVVVVPATSKVAEELFPPTVTST